MIDEAELDRDHGKLPQNRSNVLGWIAIACMAFMWFLMLAPKFVGALLPAFEGPFFWLVPLAMIVLPVIAAARGSKWWLTVTAAGVITLSAFLRIVLD
jgi:hypothetical protein